MSAQQSIYDTLMGQSVDDSPEVTPQDLQRQQLLKVLYERAGVPPEVSAQQQYDKMMGRDQTGVKGLLMRALAGAGEGIRQYNDPKYPGLYQSLVGQKEQQFKDTVPLLRSYEDASARRDVARSKSQDAALANITKLEIENRKLLNSAPINTAKATQLRADSEKKLAEAQAAREKGEFTKAQRLQEEVKTQLLSNFGTDRLAASTTEALISSGQKPAAGGYNPEDFLRGKALNSIASNAGRILGQPLGGRTSTSTSPVQVGMDADRNPIYETLTRTTTSNPAPKNDAAMKVITDILGKQKTSAPQVVSPRSVTAPPPVSTSPAPPATSTGGSFSIKLKPGQILKNDKATYDTAVTFSVPLAVARQSLLDNQDAVKKYFGKISGSNAAFRLQDFLSDPNVNLIKPIDASIKSALGMLANTEFVQRFQLTGKQTNAKEMEDVQRFTPNTQDTFEQAMGKLMQLEMLNNLQISYLEHNISGDELRKAAAKVPTIVTEKLGKLKTGKKLTSGELDPDNIFFTNFVKEKQDSLVQKYRRKK